ncbi:MAG TPA: tRNA lysidine(34) synthetase TilS, partial [Bacteroidales bacterium]|nr:tRNA lysidine(34) synthetase TilS [Bacteroidales bacterium]
MINRVRQYIEKNHLLVKNLPVLTAVSGGADPVALLDILLRLGYQCMVAHCNFHLRGAESDRDEQFVRNLCKSRNIPLYVNHFSTEQIAKEHGISVEMAARDLRYAWFEECRKMFHCQAIAVAHHQNDQAETILLNIKRGTGIRGLAGMAPRNGLIVRPLLCVQRQDILAYLSLQKQSYVEDSTNADTRFRRNAIRKQLEQYSPSDIRHFAHTGECMQGYMLLIEDVIKNVQEKIVTKESNETKIHIPSLLRYPYARTLLFELLHPYGFTDVEQIFSSLGKNSGKRFFSGQFSVLKDRNCLVITPIHEKQTVTPAVSCIVRSLSPNESLPKADDKRCFLDKRIAGKSLTVRRWKEGDSFCPLGMYGRKKISDFLTDLKLSLNEKDNVFVLC